MVSLISSLVAIRMAGAWRSEGELPAGFATAEYVGKFCFDWAPLADGETQMEGIDDGKISFRLDGNLPLVNKLHFAIFDDENQHWPRVRRDWDSLTCEDFREAANTFYAVGPKLAAAPHEFHLTIGVHEHVRPRFWYFTWINCGEGLPNSLSYELHAVNPLQGSQAEFSMDRRNPVPVELIFMFLFAGVFAVLLVLYNLPCDWRARPLLAVLQASATCSACSCLCLKVHNDVYARDGLGLALAEILGLLFACAAKALLAVIMFLLARGWSLIADNADASRRGFITIVFVGIIVLSVGCEIHGQFFHDQSTSLYLYQSWPGMFILALNLVLLGAASYLLYETYRKEASREVRAFYRLMAIANMSYFASLPLICMLAEFSHPWNRRKYVESAELTIRFAAIAFLLYCLWPTLLEERVPLRPAKSGAEPLDFEERAEEGEADCLTDGDTE
jgi:hypothetical protein